MNIRIAFAAAVLAASTGLALAQTPPSPLSPPSGAQMPPALGGEGPRDDMGPRDGMGPPDGMGPRGETGPRGPYGMPGHGPGRGPGRDGASFHLKMGNRLVVVDCGADELAPCIDASRPLLDLVGGGRAKVPPSQPMGGMMPPPAPGDLPDGPPPAGDAMPPMPGADVPPSPVN